MCGIFGIITTNSRARIEEAMARGVRSLAHRGPDDEGIEYICEEPEGLTVALAHRRLAILDLSPAGHQPMRDEETGNWITYNGEVFNFREVRTQLGRRGLRFNSESDTEVVLKSFGLAEHRAIADWRGMFAFGFWNAVKRELVLARDRVGIKPLYYFHDHENFIFASEVRALLASGLVPRKLSRAAVESYLSFGSVQQPLTIIENVFAVLPGHTLVFKNGQIAENPYWELRPAFVPPHSHDVRNISEEINELLMDSVRLRLVSDVAVGVFLSGGIDSSAIVSLIRRVTSGDLKTYSVCFAEDGFNEQPYAEKIARHYRTDHVSIPVTEDEILARLPSALCAMDQPSVDGLNTWIVSEATANAGLKVAISGLGGDELFAGYRVFNTVARDERLRLQVKNVPRGLRRAAAAAIELFAADGRARKLGSLLRSDHLHEHSVFLRRRLFTGGQCQALLGASREGCHTHSRLNNWMARLSGNCAVADPINQTSALEIGGYLSNTLLRDTDVMSMAHGLEVRIPLIDHKIIELMLGIPGHIKLRDRDPKWMLVQAAGDLPREIVDRPKRGFELPFKHWLPSVLRGEVENSLRDAPLTDLLQLSAIEQTWSEFIDGRQTWSRVWSLYVLGEWMKLNISEK